MASKKLILAAGVLFVGGAAAIAAVGHREGRSGHRGGSHDGMYDIAQGYGAQGYGDSEGRGRRHRGGHEGMGGQGFDDPRGDRMGGDRFGRDTGGDRDMRGGWFRRGVSTQDFETRTRERFARLDRNSDGVIDGSEVEAAMSPPGGERRSGMREGMADRSMGRAIGRTDANRDRRTTRAEVLDRVRRDFARMDLDGDGRITDADLPPVMRGRDVLKGAGAMGGGGRGGPLMGGMMGGLGRLIAADANKDGVVTLDEVLAEAGRRFDLMDRNKDGTLDSADRDAMAKEMSDYRVRRFMHANGAAKEGRVTREQFFATAKERFAERDIDHDGRSDDARPRRGRGPGPDSGPGKRPDSGPGKRPDSGPGNRPDSGPGNRPGTAPDAAPQGPAAPDRK